MQMSKKTDVSSTRLFKVKTEKASLLKNRKNGKLNASTNSLTHGLNKFTFGGLEKVTNSFDKMIHSLDRPKKDSSTKKKNIDHGIESDIDDNVSISDNTSAASQSYFVPLNKSGDKYTEAIFKPESSICPSTEFNTEEQTRTLKPKVSFAHASLDVFEESTRNTFITTFQSICEVIYRLHDETRKGPRQLGPINTTLYENYHLESALIDLVEEIFDFKQGQAWLYVQLQYFIRPLIHRLGGHVVNRYLKLTRLVLRGIDFIIREKSIANYCLLLRLSLWPNDQPALPDPIKTESEKERIRYLLENSLSTIISGNFNLIAKGNPFMSKLETVEKMKFLMDVFQHKKLNKHLLYIVLDLILVHVLPQNTLTGRSFRDF
jgi:hypothetical protein